MMKALKRLNKGWRKYLLELAVIIIILLVVRQYQHRDIVSEQVLPLSGQMLDQRVINWSDYQGKPLLIHFWASWCPVCRLEEQSIQSISEDYNVITVASWSDDTADYMQKQGLNFATLDDTAGKWAQRYGISAVPVSIMLGSEGQIEFIESGFSTETGLRLRLWWLGL